MVIVFNRAGILVLALAIASWVGVQAAGLGQWRLVAGFGAMALLGTALELQPRLAFRPRYFWLVPAWLAGLAGLGLSLRQAGSPSAGNVTLGLTGAVGVVGLGWAIARKPGGGWLAGVAGAAAVVTGLQVLMYARPEWKHPVIYFLNAAGILAIIGCAYKLSLARQTPAELAKAPDAAAR